MDRGWVKLWVKSLDSGIMQNAELWTFWSWCLMKATRKPYKQLVGLQMIDLEPGQFVFGRRQATKELPLSEQTIRTCLKKLTILKNLTIQATHNYSIITIMNWDIYQGDNRDANPLSNHQLTQCQPSANPVLTTKESIKSKRVKEEKKKQIQSDFVLPEWMDQKTWADFETHRKKLKVPMGDGARRGVIRELEKLKIKGFIPQEMLEYAMMKGWRTVYEPKESINGTAQNKSVNRLGQDVSYIEEMKKEREERERQKKEADNAKREL